MKKIFLLLLISIVSTKAYSQSYDAIQNFVQVTGKAKRMVAPDRFELQIIIDETATKGKTSVRELESEMVKVLKSLKIDCDENLTIAYVSSDYIKRKGAVSKSTYLLRLNDGELLQRVYDDLGELDITSLKLTKSYNSQQDRYEAEVRSEALLNAREVAQSMAATFDQEIGACFFMSYNVSYTSTNRSDIIFVGYGSSTRKELTGGHNPLSFEKQEISAQVTAKFLLKIPDEQRKLKF